MDAKGMNHSNRTSEIQVQRFASSSFSFGSSDCEVIMIMTMEIRV